VSGFDPLDMGRRLVAMRRRRLARDEDEQNALFAARASQDYWNAARSNANAPTPAETSDAPRAPLPFVGPSAPAPADRSSLAEEEWNFSRAGSAGGGAGKAAAGASAAPARSKTAASSPGGGAAVLRSPGAAKAGLATGSQAAVVKLASYGAGSVRAGALLNYQSHKGELALEREDGTLVFGKQAVGDLAAQWRDEADGREPSNDVLSFTLTLSSQAPTPEHVREALGDALKGHAFAWRMEENQIHVVMVAASVERGDSGKLERIYPNEKSLARLHGRIDGALNIETSRREVRWAHGVEGATTELANLTKGGTIEAETSGGLAIDEAAGRLFLQRTRVAPDAKAKGFNANLELAKSWERGMRSQGRRDFAHVILSAKAGTDKEAFMDAARATLAKEFAGHEYVFVMHTNRQHIHVHAAIRLTNAEGKKIDPRIADFSLWRSTLAEEARERNIPMESVRRFDQAHAPGYKLKDVNMVERGIAPEAARRRIERVKNKEIHRPTRPEGRHRANEAARQWSNLAGRKVFGALPPLAQGAMRLYRAEPVAAEGSHKTMMFTSERAIAEQIAERNESRLVFLDVPASRLAEVLPARNQPDTIYAVPVALGSLSRESDRIDSAAILPFQRRTEAALEPILRRENSIEIAKGEARLRTVETMTTAREDIVGTLTRISDLLPEGAEKAAFEIERRRLLELSQAIIASQAKLEALPVKLEGDRYVEPKPTDTKNALITHEKKGDEIHYSRHDAATGALQTLAFVDQGKQLEVKDWKNPETVLAALQVASTKWETITVNGNDAYKETAARLAAEHGFKITNPEMQDRIQQLRAEAESKKSLLAEGAPEAEKTQARPAPAITTTTPAERSLHLASIREQVDFETERETTQAGAAAKAAKTSKAESDAATPTRAPREAAAAREAARTVDSDKSTPMQPDPAQSEEVQELRHAQQRVLTQEQRDRQELAIRNREAFREKQSRKTENESEGQSE
jgi:hypothetical protein